MVNHDPIKNMPSVKEVGDTFLAYYRNLGYKLMSGSSLLSDALPMTFVMSAGMVQFEQLSEQPRDGNQFVLIQNCFRHFDLEKVGNSDFHLSLFQMPGAFYFGPPDRPQTVWQIWDLLTQVYSFEPSRLFVTYYAGGRVGRQSFPPDLETAAAWRAAGITEAQIISLPAASNFWRQSARMVGVANSHKCGPTTEVFFDRGFSLGCEPTCRPGCPCGRFVEILNCLFITLFIDEQIGQIIPLEEPFNEIVIGQERVAALLQGASSVYEIDALSHLVQQVRCFSKSELLTVADTRRHEQQLVDHLRALLFLIQDGAPAPGKGGRANIVEKLVREMLTSTRLLGISDPGFMRSMLYLVEELYPELKSAHSKFMEYCLIEEARFTHTLQIGLRRFEQELQQRGAHQVSGKDVLRYEKKNGIPFSLLGFLLRQKQISYNQEEYLAALGHFRQQEPEIQSAIEDGY